MVAPIFHMVSGAPNPVAPFSHAVETDGWIILCGQVANDPEDEDAALPEGVEAQTHRVMETLKTVLGGIGLGLEHVVATRVFLTHFKEDFERMNAVYKSYFAADRLPARTTIGVTGLALDALVEIDFIARRS